MTQSWYRKMAPGLVGTACVWMALAPVSGWAGTAASNARQIHVEGSAQISVVPDMATLTLGVQSFDAEAQGAMRETSRRMVAVIDTLVAAGIAPDDMQTSQLSLSPRWEQDRTQGNPSGRKLVGFEASNMLTIEIYDLDSIGPVLDQVLSVGANNFRGLQFGLKNPEALDDQLRQAAVQDAIDAAEVLTRAAGVALGPVRTISDQSGHRGSPMFAMEAARSDFVPIAPGALDFSHSVSVVFDLKDLD